MKTNLRLISSVVLMALLFTACVKDTDFSQTDDVLLTPVVELNLIYFDAEASDFFDPVTSNSILTIRDTTNLEFLNEDIGTNIKRAEFLFQFTNSIPREFEVLFQFLSEQNDTTYTAQTTVAEGTVPAPVATEFIEIVEGDAINELTQASKVIVSVTIPSSNATLEGNLNLQSKTTYFLEF